MLTLEEIVDYIDEIIDTEADIPQAADANERALATGIIMCLEEFKDWIQTNWKLK